MFKTKAKLGLTLDVAAYGAGPRGGARAALVLALLVVWSSAGVEVPLARAAISSSGPSIASVTSGSTPFFATIVVNNVVTSQVTSVGFSIRPRRNTKSVAVGASYGSTYLSSSGLLDSIAGTVTVPIFGLYDNFSNTVTVKVTTSSTNKKSGGTKVTSLTATVVSGAWSDPGAAVYENPIVRVPRQSTVSLSFSFFMMKTWGTSASPVIIDSDGYVRWVGSFGFGTPAAALWGNKIWMGQPSTGILYSLPLTGGAPTLVANLGVSPYNITNFHHNIGVTSKGLLIDVDTSTTIESVIAVVNSAGAVTKMFDMGQILGSYLLAHGEDPSTWMGSDWFHSNAATYWPARNELIVSSRENFVVALNYDTSAIDWILGDPTKEWYVSYPSLRALSLTVTGNGLVPIGQHAVSIDSSGNLMLFDNGLQGNVTASGGPSRSYARAASYSIDTDAMTATVTWNYDHGQDIYSPICSSVYQDGSGSVLVDFASIGEIVNTAREARVMGLSSMGSNQVAFDFSYSGGFPWGWNAVPIHLENVTF